MSVIYNDSVKNAQLQIAVDAIDAGSGNGVMNVGTAGMAIILATITLNNPCATVANRVMSFSGLPLSTIAVAGGTAAEANICDSNGTIIISGLTVGTPGGTFDAIINDATIIAGGIVSLLTATISG